MKPLRRYLVVLAFLLMVPNVGARELLQGDQCVIPEGETMQGTLFVLCRDLIIDGTLDGNLIGGAVQTTINGDVLDGIYLIGGQFDLFGELQDDLHYIGAVLNLHDGAAFGTEVSDLFSLSMSTHLHSGSSVPGSLVVLGYQLLVNGDVAGEVAFWGSAFEIGGRIDGDINADVGNSEDTEGTAQLETLFLLLPVEISLVNPGLRVSESATISGELQYRSPTRGEVPEAVVEGDIVFDALPQQAQITDITDEETFWREAERYVVSSMREFATLAVVGALGLVFVPGLMQAPIRNLRERPLTSLGVGTLTFILSFPVVVIAVVVSLLVVFALSLLQVGNLTIAGVVVLIILNVGGASLFYFVAIFVARSVVCLALGRRLLRVPFDDDGTMRFLYIGLAFGSVLIAAAVSLPVIGWLVNAITLFIGLGAIVNLVQAELRNIREGNMYTPAGSPPSGTRFGSRRFVEVEPPLLQEQTEPSVPAPRPTPKPRPRHNVGTNDLPDGFVWWDEM
ncbi:MAG: hypothetical protein AAF125_06965 [Chloroflexota bacterium]